MIQCFPKYPVAIGFAITGERYPAPNRQQQLRRAVNGQHISEALENTNGIIVQILFVSFRYANLFCYRVHFLVFKKMESRPEFYS